MDFAYTVAKDSTEGEIIAEFAPVDLAWDSAVIHVYVNFMVDNNYGADADGRRGGVMVFLEELEIRNIQLFSAGVHQRDMDMTKIVETDLDKLCEAAEGQAWDHYERERDS